MKPQKLKKLKKLILKLQRLKQKKLTLKLQLLKQKKQKKLTLKLQLLKQKKQRKQIKQKRHKNLDYTIKKGTLLLKVVIMEKQIPMAMITETATMEMIMETLMVTIMMENTTEI